MPGDSFKFIGNATALVRLGPFTILTDPNFLHAGQRAYLGYGLISKRLKDPAMRIADLPALDAVVLSHLHGDHWDRVTRRELDQTVPILTTPKAARALHRQRFRRALGLATWESHQFHRDGSTLRVTALPGRHAPGLAEHLLPPVMGSLLELTGGSRTFAKRLYITGDTLLFAGLREISRRFPDIDVTVLHLGGTRLPGGLVVTMTGEQGAELAEMVGSPKLLPVHYDDYSVMKDPLSSFTRAVERRGLGDPVVYVERGQTVAL